MKNFKARTIIAVCLLSGSTAFNQDLELTSASGGYSEGANGSVSWSIGEPIITTSEGFSMDVTQGFHQSNIHVVSVENNEEIGISIYPNPTNNFVNIESEKPLRVSIMDISGRLIRVVDVTDSNKQVDVTDLSRGTYTLIFESAGKIVKTVKIVKQ